jgi:hypothetical protein
MDTKKMTDKEKIEYLKHILDQCISIPGALCFQTTTFAHMRLNYISKLATNTLENIDKL